MSKTRKYLFGPVPSRRLGLSLGVDIVPFKACTLDCIYCQLGKTTTKTIERREYVPVAPVVHELKKILSEGVKPDYITISGSGEPTLNTKLGELIVGIKKITNIPIAILTNGTLLYLPDVRADCAKANIVAPSLDAGDENVFQLINRPHNDITFQNLLAGLRTFRSEFSGLIWLEIFLIDGINTNPDQIDKLKTLALSIQPDKIHLNTAVRPTAEKVKMVGKEKLKEIAKVFGPKCEVIADFSLHRQVQKVQDTAESVLSMLKRRPCSLDDICSSLGIHRNEAIKYITHLQNEKLISSIQQGGTTFYTSC